jgi:adenylate kinase family enzyme
VLLIGNSGSGKTKLAEELAALTGLPLVHLDREYWRPGWREPTPEEWEDQVRELVSGDAWILDGNYSRTLDLRLSRADTAIFLDLPTLACIRGIAGRYLRWRGRTRPDLPDGCEEKIDLKFVRYVLAYRRSRRPRMLDRLSRFDGDVVVLHNRRDVRRYAQVCR